METESLNTLLPMMETADAPFLSQSADCWQENIDWLLSQGLIQEAPAVSDVMVDLLKLTELQNPLTGLNFQGTGKLTTPLGANLYRTSVLPSGTAIGLDRRFALELVQGSDVMVEYDKLIDRQLERAAITTISGFAKIFSEASRVLEV